MTAPLLEAVPNFSEGRDLGVVRAIVDAIRAAGADVLDWSADRDHHRAVVTLVGTPAVVEEAAIAGARVAIRAIDLRRHKGLHPRIGAVDVLPFVPLLGLSLSDARAVAHRAGRRLAQELGVPVFFYGHASDPPGRALPELRHGGYESLVGAWPAGRTPDLLPDRWGYPGAHPSAGAVCVGARPVLLAWNVAVGGVPFETAQRVVAELRQAGGGFPGVRALALELPERGRLQISMNLEDPEAVSPMAVFQALERRLHEAGGHVIETEVVGLVPDPLVVSAAAERLRLAPHTGDRLLSRRIVDHLARHDTAAREAARGE